MRLVFMGTPEFAVPSLRTLAKSSHSVVGVVTQPDRPKGRGLQLAASPVKKEAIRLGIPVVQPENVKDLEFLERLRRWEGVCFAVVGFRILPPEVYEMPPRGTVNLHASLLPEYRGAAPIQWVLINGEKRTGVTTFFIERKVDTGDLILQEEVSIGQEETAGELHDRLALVGAGLLLRTMDRIEQGRVERIPQKGTPTRAPKILPEDCEIDWSQPAERIVNLVRGLSPRPGAFTLWEGKRLKILRASVSQEGNKTVSRQPGRIVGVSEEGIVVEGGKGRVCIREIQVEGRRRMEVEAFLRGHPISLNRVLGSGCETD